MIRCSKCEGWGITSYEADGSPNACGQNDRVVASFAEYADASAWVEWREYRALVNAECDAATEQVSS